MIILLVVAFLVLQNCEDIDDQPVRTSGVNISSIIFENNGYTINWIKFDDAEFHSYRIEKSIEPGMHDYSVIYTSYNINEVTFFDPDVNPDINWHYRITVIIEKKGQIYPA